MSCKYDITITEQQTLIQLISVQLVEQVNPQTIVSNISSFLQLTEPILIDNTNVCLYNCLSSCIYNHIDFINGSFTYDISSTMSCVVTCYPQQKPKQSKSSGGAANLQQEVAALIEQKESQLAGVLGELEHTLDYFNEDIERILKILSLTIIGYSVFIGQRLFHQGIQTIVFAGKSIGEAIEFLVQPFKAATSAKEIADSGTIAAAAFTGVAPGPLPHFHDAIILANANAAEAITNFEGEVTEEISGMGSDAESVSDIVGTGSDIVFDAVRIGFDFASLGAQIQQTDIALKEIKKQMDEAGAAAEAAAADITDKYDQAIAAREEMIEFQNEFDSVIDETISKVS